MAVIDGLCGHGLGILLGYHNKGLRLGRPCASDDPPISARTMPRPDERLIRQARAGSAAADPAAGGPREDPPLSKTRRKAQMHALQDMGEALVALEPKRLAELAAEASLPETLVDAIRDAREITAWGARKRQLQYIGKLMREVDPDPIRRRLDLLAHGRDTGAAHLHALEQWRDRLLAEPATLDRLVAEYPSLDRSRFRALIHKARDERERGAAPHAFRALFRELKALAGAR
jgi:ribosome-associated protein